MLVQKGLMILIFNFLIIGFVVLALIIINYLIIIKSFRSFLKDFIRRNETYQVKHNALSQEENDDEKVDR
jgi:hypothetical protein